MTSKKNMLDSGLPTIDGEDSNVHELTGDNGEKGYFNSQKDRRDSVRDDNEVIRLKIVELRVIGSNKNKSNEKRKAALELLDMYERNNSALHIFRNRERFRELQQILRKELSRFYDMHVQNMERYTE